MDEKLDIIIDKLEQMQNDIDKMKNALQVVTRNQTVIEKGLAENFDRVINNQVVGLKEIYKITKDIK